MITTISNSQSGIILKQQLQEFGPELRNKAKRKHASYKRKGIIRSEYDDDIWVLTDQKNNYRLVFNYRKDDLKSVCEDNAVSYECFIEDLKVFSMTRIGTCTLASLRKMVTYIIDQTIAGSYYSSDATPEASDISQTMYFVEFVRIIAPAKTPYIDKCCWLISTLREREANIIRAQDHPCSLNEFQSYFKFDQILREWWEEKADIRQKQLYFPLYLFWVLTTILPLRVTEFCFLPFECIYKEGGLFHIVIRRSRLKGNNEEFPKLHTYTIEGDYTTHSYEIPEWLYNEIYWYRKVSEDYQRSYQLLFSVDFMKSIEKKPHMCPHPEGTVFDSADLGDLLKSFYAEIVMEQYQMKIVSEADLEVRFRTDDGSYELYDDEIMMILPKHTRHLAMINLVLRGCNPIIIKEFAGHTNGATSFNYYGNISKTVRCRTKILYDRHKNRSQQKKNIAITTINARSLMIDENSDYIEVDAGKCHSKHFLHSKPDDCIACGGNCLNCGYLTPNRKDAVIPSEDFIEKEMAYIAQLLNDDDIENKLTEYQIRMNRLQHNLANLAAIIWQEEEEKDAEEEKV